MTWDDHTYLVVEGGLGCLGGKIDETIVKMSKCRNVEMMGIQLERTNIPQRGQSSSLVPGFLVMQD